MKRALILFLSVFAFAQSFSQTRLIANKSHSGNATSYLSFAASGNFGEPPPILKSVEKINDTIVVMTHQEWYDTSLVWSDTFYHHPIFSNPNMPVDSIRKTYYMQDVEFKNFDRPVQGTPAVRPRKQSGTGAKSDAKPRHDLPAGKRDGGKKKSVLWLFVIGGGVFLGGGLFSRRFLVSEQKG
jgi:hypothetical protein